MARKVFINYRRAQNLKDAQLLEKVLQKYFGSSGVFLDTSGLEAGKSWRDKLKSEIDSSAAMVSLIGKDWVTAADDQGRRRLLDPDDFVRFEINRAILDKIHLMPVLIDGASMPGIRDVPYDLLPLTDQQAMLLRKETFDDDATRIAEQLKVLMAQKHGVSRTVLAGTVVAAALAGAAVPLVSMHLGLLQPATDGVLLKALGEAQRNTREAESALSSAQAARDGAYRQLQDAQNVLTQVRNQAAQSEQRAKTAEEDLSRMKAALAAAQAAVAAAADRIKKAEAELDAARAAEALATDRAKKAEEERDNARVASGPAVKDNKAGIEGRANVPLTAVELAMLKPKDRFKECEHCPEMVAVPSGRFTMGTPEGDNTGYSDERPPHEVTIPKAFAAGRWTVTIDEWSACVSEGRCSNRSPLEKGAGKGRYPAIEVSWNDAQEYVAWLNGKVGGRPYRLLSESEWEYVARAGTQTRYFWGDDIGKNQANCDGCGSRWDGTQTAPVGSFAANAFGLYDVHGNVWQWVEDCWNETYKDKPPGLKANGGAWEGLDCTYRVARGGSWSGNPRDLRAANRGKYLPSGHFNYIGLRLARTLPSAVQ